MEASGQQGPLGDFSEKPVREEATEISQNMLAQAPFRAEWARIASASLLAQENPPCDSPAAPPVLEGQSEAPSPGGRRKCPEGL